MDLYAVFKIEGDDVEQESVWLKLDAAKQFLEKCRKRDPEGWYRIFQLHDY